MPQLFAGDLKMLSFENRRKAQITRLSENVQGDRLEMLRLFLNVKGFEFAAMIGVTPSHYSKLILGTVELNLYTAKKIAKLEIVDIFWLLAW